jgi:(p)ppGpp synthase/HD superfamily hydrolase
LGKGIVVHNKNCKNVQQLMINKDRIVEVEWAKNDTKHIQSVRLLATTENRTGMLAGITNAIAEIKTGIRDARANISKDDRGLIEVTSKFFDKNISTGCRFDRKSAGCNCCRKSKFLNDERCRKIIENRKYS